MDFTVSQWSCWPVFEAGYFSSKNVRAVEVLCRCKLCLLWIHGPELVNKRQLQSALADLGLSKHIPKWEIPLKFNGIIIIFIGFISFNHHFPAFLVTGHNFQAPKRPGEGGRADAFDVAPADGELEPWGEWNGGIPYEIGSQVEPMRVFFQKLNVDWLMSNDVNVNWMLKFWVHW